MSASMVDQVQPGTLERETPCVIASEEGAHRDLARITAVDRGRYRIALGVQEQSAVLSGQFLHQARGPVDLPCVGDWVAVQPCTHGGVAVIRALMPRRTVLRRKAPGACAEMQLLAANIDTAFLVQSCQYDFNPRRLERYLVMVADGGVEPVVLLAKSDLAPHAALAGMLEAVQAISPVSVIVLSCRTGEGLDTVRQALMPGKTYCLLGSSGVGKTTLLNHLLGREQFATSAVSGTGEGTHTTTRRQLIRLDQGAFLVDTPGMRELGLVDVEEGLEDGFGRIAALAQACRFSDCSHADEPGCAVKAAVERGELPADQYGSYLKLRQEVAFHEMSALEKRHKDKAFGRLKKSVRKRMRD